MSSHQGWIKLHRAVLDWQWFSDPNTTHVFMYCLLKANHKDNMHRDTLVKRGTFLTGRDLISRETGCSVREVRTALKRLESANVLTSKTSRQGTVIEVLNYDRYQAGDQQNDQQATNKRPTNDQQTSSNKTEEKEENENNTLSDQDPPAEDGEFELFEEEIETGPSIDDEVMRVWNAYPSKTGRKAALPHIKRAVKAHGADWIIEKIQAYEIAYANMGWPYKHGSTYFNQDSYHDDLPTPPKAPKQTQHKF